MQFLITVSVILLLINNSICVNQVKYNSKTIYELGKKWIYVSDNLKLNWYKSAYYCASMGMQLLTIRTAEENFLLSEFIKNYEPKLNNIWTAGNDLGNEGNWIWMSTGEPFQYSHWTESQPDNYNNVENCLEIGYSFINWRNYDYLYWNDNGCGGIYSFICETKK